MNLMKRITWIAFICCCFSGGMSAQTYEQTVRQALSAAEHDSLDQAEELFRQALKISPGDHRNALVYQYIGQVIETKYWNNPSDVKTVEEIIFNYSKAIELQPQNRSMLFSRANFYLSMDNYGKAIHDYTTILENDRQNTDALNRRAFAYYQNREYDKAEADYNAVLAEALRSMPSGHPCTRRAGRWSWRSLISAAPFSSNPRILPIIRREPTFTRHRGRKKWQRPTAARQPAAELEWKSYMMDLQITKKTESLGHC